MGLIGIFAKCIDAVCVIVGLFTAYHVYKEPTTDNPFKRYRIIISLLLAFCFVMLFTANGKILMIFDVIALIVWWIQWYFDMKDDKYSIKRFDRKYRLKHQN